MTPRRVPESTIRNAALQGAGNRIEEGTGPLIINGPQTHAPGNTIDITDGTVTLNTNAGAPDAIDLAINVSNINAHLDLRSIQHLDALDVQRGRATLAPDGENGLITLRIALGQEDATIDLHDNPLIIHATPDTCDELLQTGAPSRLHRLTPPTPKNPHNPPRPQNPPPFADPPAPAGTRFATSR